MILSDYNVYHDVYYCHFPLDSWYTVVFTVYNSSMIMYYCNKHFIRQFYCLILLMIQWYSTNHVYLHRFSRLRFCVCV